MAQDLQIPSSFQNRGMSKVFQGRVTLDDNLADGIQQGFPVMHYKGKIWALKYRGDRKVITRKDDGTPAGHLDVVILKQAKGKSKQFYAGTYDPTSSDGTPPTCASLDGIVPNADVPQKQSEFCATCPQNVWKTDAQTGRRGRPCSDRKRLAILVMPNQTEPLFGKPILDPILLDVPPDSMQSLATMGDTMTHQGFHYSGYLTRITFDPNKAHPSMLFRPIRPLEDSEAEAVIKLQEDPSVERIVGIEQSVQNGGQQVIAPVTAPVTPRIAQPVSEEEIEEAETEEPSGLAGAFGGAQQAAPAPAPATRTRTRKPKETPAAAAPATAPTANVTPMNGHTGDADISDDDLDNEIASLISKKN